MLYKLRLGSPAERTDESPARSKSMNLQEPARRPLTLAWAAKFALHVALLFVGLILAYELRRAMPLTWWVTDADAVRVVRWAALYALIGAGVELVFQSERSAWRFASMREVLGLVRNVTVTSGIFLGVIFFVDRGVQLPRSVLPLAWLISLALLVGLRIAWRLPHDPGLALHLFPSWWRQSEASRTPALLVGPMVAVEPQLRLLRDPSSSYRPVGVISPVSEEVGLRLHGVPFVGDLKSWRSTPGNFVAKGVEPHAIIFLDDPVQAYGISTERIGELRRAGHRLLKPQILGDIDGAPSHSPRLEEIPLEGFLARNPISLNPEPVRELIAGRRVLVTGAGGSIGSEICRQLLAFGCDHLTMVDHSEFLLFEIDRELSGVKPFITRRAVLANVRDEARVRELFLHERPEIVFHAAALKHVTLVENNPAEGVLTNVLGTWNVIQSAIAAGTSQFVLISTDKAVNPTNIMGATKRIAETLLLLAPPGRTRLSAVRFGNVLGSAGSVVPIFREQISRGGPVSVTHPDVNRYFMTIPEAVQLVLHSTAISGGRSDNKPSKFLLEMGEPVRIADLARQMIQLSGKTPDVDIMIEFTGLKKGEKIAEELADEGEKTRPSVEGILEVVGDGQVQAFEPAHLGALISAAEAGRDQDVTMLVAQAIQDIRGSANVHVEQDGS